MPPKPNRYSDAVLKTGHSKADPNTSDIGALGEALVAQWLRDRGWLVLQQRWHCRWGELDLVVGQLSPHDPTQPIALAFVEVKTRSRGNWDCDGALALTTRKRAKLWRAAQLFLADHPTWAELPCQFDVALVCSQQIVPGKPSRLQSDLTPLDPIETKATMAGYHLTMQAYIPAAFTLD